MLNWKKTKAILALASLATAPVLQQHFGAVDLPTRQIIGEAVGHRKFNSKTWIRDDGTASSRFSQTPVHFKDANGWQDIDNSFVSDGLTRFKNKNFFEVSVPNVFTNGQVGKLGGKQITFVPLAANPVSPIFPETETDHGDFNMMTQKYDKFARYVDAWTATDVEYRAKYYGMKENIVVKNNTAPTTFKFRLDHNFPNVIQQTGKRIMKFTDGVNTIEIDAITAQDAKGRDVPITTSWNPPENILTLSYNPVFVTSTTTFSAVYPITIDPTTPFHIERTEVTSFDAWIDMCFPAGQTFAQQRTDTNNCTTTNNNDGLTNIASIGGTGHVPSRPTQARTWLQWNTATTITSGATINATASTSIGLVNSAAPVDNFNDAEAYIGIMQATTSGPLPLQVSVADGDYKRVTGLFSNLQLLASSSLPALAADGNCKGHDITTMANGEARCFELNTTGRANIAIAGGTYATSTFGLCEGHDCTFQTFTVAEGNSNVTFSSTEGANSPILDVDWTAASVAVAIPPADVIFFSWLEKFINKAYAYGQ